MVFLTVLVYLFLQMCLMWALYRWLRNPSVVDVSWSLGLMVSGLIYLFWDQWQTRSIFIAVCLSIWAMRLAIYLFVTRIRLGHVDKRYLTLSDDWKMSPSLGFFLNFQLQAVLIFILSIVFWFAAQVSSPDFSVLDGLGVLLVCVGVLGESVADWQLQNFKKKKVGQLCRVGLWHYSRHPNYFFDWLTWVGFMFFALPAPYGWMGIVSPLTLYHIFNYVTGPLTEKGSVASKGQAYIDYQQSTNMFFPWLTRQPR